MLQIKSKIEKFKRRIEVFDFAKAIAIILVMWGHTTGNFDDPLFRRVLYSFHMPLFFILAGLCIKPHFVLGFDEWKNFIKKNILALLVPYFIWALIYAPFSFSIFGGILYGSWESIASTKTLTSLWYLPTFFLARIFTQIGINVLYKLKVKNIHLGCIIASILVMAIGVLIPHINGGYFFGFDVAIVATSFILFGVGVRECVIINSQEHLLYLILFTIITATLFFFGTIDRGDDLKLMRMCAAEYGNIFWFLYNSFFGSALVIGVARLISRLSKESALPFSTSVISYIGQNTLGIFLLHKPFLQEIILPFTQKLIGNYLQTEVVGLIAVFITMPFCLIMCFVINRYIPELLGEFPRIVESDNIK